MSEDDAQLLHRGTGGGTCMKESARNTGSPMAWSRMTNRAPARDRPGPHGVAERFVIPLKPGNAGGGKGPQFKTDARRSEGPGDWATYQLRTIQKLRTALHAKAKAEPGQFSLRGRYNPLKGSKRRRKTKEIQSERNPRKFQENSKEKPRDFEGIPNLSRQRSAAPPIGWKRHPSGCGGQSVSVTFMRCGGWSGSRPRRRAVASATW